MAYPNKLISRQLYIEADIHSLGNYLRGLIHGDIVAIKIRQALPPEQCKKVLENFEKSNGMYVRTDGVPGRMVGVNSFLKDPSEILDSYIEHKAYSEMLFEGSSNLFRLLFDCEEDAGYRVRNVYIRGVPAPTYRATVWAEQENSNHQVLKAHTDWPQVKYSKLEYSDVENPIAINFYPSHPAKGRSILRIFDFIPSFQWLKQRGIQHSGYPIPLKDLSQYSYLDIQPESGDIVLFNSNYVHSVFSSHEHNDCVRLNINGFMGYSPRENRLLHWS